MHLRTWLLAIVLLVTTSTLATAQIEHCAAILNDGIRDSYDLNTSSDYERTLATLLSMSNQQLQSAQSSNNFGFNVPVPIGDAFANLGLNAGDSSDRLRRIRSSYQSQGMEGLSKSDYVWLTQRVVNDAIPNAWLRCIELTVANQPEGVLVSIDDDVADRFAVKLQWSQQIVGQAAPEIDTIVATGVALRAPFALQPGTVLNNLQNYVQPFERTDSAEATITVSFRNNNSVFLRLPALRAQSTADQLAGVWTLSGMPLATKVYACTSSCMRVVSTPNGPRMQTKRWSGIHTETGTSVHPGQLPPVAVVEADQITVSFFDGTAVLQFRGRVVGQDQSYLPFGLPLSPFPQLTPGSTETEQLWLKYEIDDGRILIKDVLVDNHSVRALVDPNEDPWNPPPIEIEFASPKLTILKVGRTRVQLTRPEGS